MCISSWVNGWSENAHMHYLLCSWGVLMELENWLSGGCSSSAWMVWEKSQELLHWVKICSSARADLPIHTHRSRSYIEICSFYYHNFKCQLSSSLSSSVSSHCLAPCRPVQKPAKRKHWFQVEEYMIPSQNHFALHSTSVLHCESLHVPVNNGLSSHSLFYAGSGHISAEGIAGFPWWEGTGAVTSAPKM